MLPHERLYSARGQKLRRRASVCVRALSLTKTYRVDELVL